MIPFVSYSWNDSYRNREEKSGSQEWEKGQRHKENRDGYKWATWGIPVVREAFCLLTIWCQYPGSDTVLLFWKMLPIGKTRQDIWNLSVVFLISTYGSTALSNKKVKKKKSMSSTTLTKQMGNYVWSHQQMQKDNLTKFNIIHDIKKEQQHL